MSNQHELDTGDSNLNNGGVSVLLDKNTTCEFTDIGRTGFIGIWLTCSFWSGG